jgi:glycosyltransferase involved in cell wall biosynthesis
VSSRPFISVLLPCYNQARYLSQAIESVLSQQNADWELVISDDASTDNSAEIIRTFAARDPRIRFYLQRPNLGMAANWNWCLRNASGRYVKFLFGDDFHSAPDALATLGTALDAHPSCTLATSARLIVGENSQTRSVADELGSDGLKPGAATLVRCLLTGKNLVGEPSAVMFRRDAGQRGFDPSYRQLIDLEFWAHLLEQGDLAYVARPLCAFRRHDEQQTAVNRLTRAGEEEGLRLQLKYLPLVQRHLATGGSQHEVRQALFRSLYFARKTRTRSDESQAHERALMRELNPVWYAAYWLRHRLTKPFSNLHKATRRFHSATRHS